MRDQHLLWIQAVEDLDSLSLPEWEFLPVSSDFTSDFIWFLANKTSDPTVTSLPLCPEWLYSRTLYSVGVCYVFLGELIKQSVFTLPAAG